MTTWVMPNQFGPSYPELGLQKYRKIKNPTWEQKQAHGEAVHLAIQAKQRQELQRATLPPKARCASGTFLNCGADIHKHLRAAARAELLAYPAKERRARTEKEWLQLYNEAMAEPQNLYKKGWTRP
jgi:hypothetical protein